MKAVLVILIMSMVFGVLCLGYCKGRQAEIDKRRYEAVAHNRRELPVYYGGGR